MCFLRHSIAALRWAINSLAPRLSCEVFLTALARRPNSDIPFEFFAIPVHQQSRILDNMPNCEVCSDLEYPKDISSQGLAAYRTVYADTNDLFESSMQGCPSCSLLQNAILAFVPDLERSDTVLIQICLQEYTYHEKSGLVYYKPSPMPFITVTDQVARKSLAKIDLFKEACKRRSINSISGDFDAQMLTGIKIHRLHGSQFRSPNIQTVIRVRAIAFYLFAVGSLTAAGTIVATPEMGLELLPSCLTG